MRITQALALLSLCGGAPAMAGGYLWISGEFKAPTSIYRYNIATGKIDLVKDLTGIDPNADVFNNLAYDGKTLYVGSDDDALFAKCDPLTGDVLNVGQYNNVFGNFEDGAYRKSSGTLWRADYGGAQLIETDTSGNGLTSRTIAGISNFCGLEWVGDTCYGTSLDGKSFGRIDITGPNSATYTIINLAGMNVNHLRGGLAYDQQDGILYMASTTQQEGFLWRVDPIAGTANLVHNLTQDSGYPGGNVLDDAMGWVPIPTPGAAALLGLGTLAAVRRRR